MLAGGVGFTGLAGLLPGELTGGVTAPGFLGGSGCFSKGAFTPIMSMRLWARVFIWNLVS